MKKFPVALQLYSVRGEMASDFEGTLRRVKEMGYDGVEFAGLFGRTPLEVRLLLEKLGLTPISAHVALAEMEKDPEGVFADYKALGCEYIAVPYLEEPYRPGKGEFGRTVARIAALGRAAREAGLTLLYHNHDFEFERTEKGNYGLDELYEEIPTDCLQTELDTCWVNVAGQDPVAYIEKYKGRAPVVHLKDFVMPGKKPAKLYNLIGMEEEEQQEGDVFEFRPFGYGVQNAKALIKAAQDAESRWLVVEQDEPSMGKSPLECAKMSIDFLKDLI